MTPLPKSIFDLLISKNFRIRTAMYIGEKKISVLKAFIDGYFYAIDSYDIQLIEYTKFSKLHDWTARYFGWKESTAGWKNIILKESNYDEEKAVDKFFEVYDRFLIDINTI